MPSTKRGNSKERTRISNPVPIIPNPSAKSTGTFTKEQKNNYRYLFDLLLDYKYSGENNKSNGKLKLKTAIKALIKKLTEQGIKIEDIEKDLPDEFKQEKTKSTESSTNSMTLFSPEELKMIALGKLPEEGSQKGSQKGGKRNHKKNKRTQKRK